MSNKSNTKTYITLAVLSAAGLALTACSSTKHERTDYSTMGYSYEPAMAEPSGAASSSYSQTTTTSSSAQQAQPQQQSAAAQSGDVTIPLREEQVSIGKTAVSQPVTIRKVVTTETVSQPVQLRKETLVIDHNVGGGAAASGGDLSGAFQEKTMTINLQEEQPLIQKQVVVKDNVTVRRSASESQATISQQVRKENVEVDKPGTGAVTLEGPFREIKESAGSQNAPQSQPQQQQQNQ